MMVITTVRLNISRKDITDMVITVESCIVLNFIPECEISVIKPHTQSIFLLVGATAEKVLNSPEE